MTSLGDNSISLGAWLFHRCMEEKPETREARVMSDEGRNLSICRSVDEEAVMAARVPRTRSGSQESEAARVSVPGSRCWHVRACTAAIGGRVSRFWSRYAMEHVCLVGFFRRRLDVHIFVKLSPGFA